MPENERLDIAKTAAEISENIDSGVCPKCGHGLIDQLISERDSDSPIIFVRHGQMCPYCWEAFL